ncbi:MAG TPA: hypothetical protein VFA59_12910 [Vicinamibacterales bacterium]|nr:hypothetical protein [Vicinamibacterales bacterium]
MRRQTLFVAAIVTFGAALYHASALLIPAFAARAYAPTYPPIRHVAFVLINLACALLLLRRPIWFVPLYALLVVQVLNGHGRVAWDAWRAAKPIYAVDVLVSIGVLAVLALLVVDALDARADAT